MSALFSELAIVFALACFLALFIGKFRQPSIVAYIAIGALLGSHGLGFLRQGDVLSELSTLGITLLLFLVGLELNTDDLKRYGKNAIVAGLLQVLLTTFAGFGIAIVLGFSVLTSFYIAFALTFSSTILVVKLLSEKKELQSLSGRLVVGIFLTQDFVALLLLMVLSGVSSGSEQISSIALGLLKGVGLAFLAWWLGKKVLEPLLHKYGRSDEYLLLLALGWGLGLAALSASPVFGFSLEIGGFLAGVSLAKSSIQHQIGARVKSLRDFFLVLFFVSLGGELVWSSFGTNWLPALVLAMFVLIGNPLIVLFILGKLGYRSRTAFLAGITVGQVSEFSLILATLGRRLGHISDEIFALLALVSVGTMIVSSFCITHGDRIFKLLEPILFKFAIFHGHSEKSSSPLSLKLKNHIVIVGSHQMGTRLAETLKKRKANFVVVDFDPEVVEKLQAQDILAICGDASDPSIQELAHMSTAKIVISTLPQLADNLSMLEILKTQGKLPKIVVSCYTDREAPELYRHGVDYVILPHQLSSVHLAHIISDSSAVSKLKTLHHKNFR